MAAILKISKYFRKVHFDIRYGKNVQNWPQKSTFYVDDVTAWRQSRPSVFMFKWNCHIFCDKGRSFLPIITTYVVYHNTEPYSFF